MPGTSDLSDRELTFESEPLLVTPEKWAKVEPFWWTSRDRFDTLDWTWHVGPPPPTPQQQSTSRKCAQAWRGSAPYPIPDDSPYWWRHPTYQEAVERQRRFNEETREEWERLMNYGSWTNLARLAPSRGYQGGLPGDLIITSGGRKYEAEKRVMMR